ncbi:SDR family NAD(P)-dependent oxidoreductase [Acetobacter orleanensis]|uniref:Short-chain dehydrogenase n=1 Tax=Acetobacter orleanensis TaxID=104099 RepID=A0A4Y3TMY1_9PROT|nr:SDR family NAD(P)-dependent oxidoreductase [Acetobacter orleanensis]KXV66092.1 dehydrogenase [Acetobacter orleanensis]PCD79557.1 dehydrogenase [Acetobacter orleanensis]GAN69750.1 oxidoreductase/SDR, dehydrogenase [Acetobacter orleanensis JCM 7639]GBR24846.1 oxidoreductase [Acetobacter orleanensis NRIC 0473]GEB82387.1 short-chain dehydrogenase [Acetobacter orleanensis]
MKHDTVLITGASSGLGRSLALTLARPGRRLFLGGRNRDRLTETARLCISRGAAADIRLCDVTDRNGMEDWVHSAGPLDMVLACAGITGGTRRATAPDGAPYEPDAQARRMFATNVEGVLNTVLPALHVMQGQPRAADGLRGRICAISSVAGIVSYPGTPSYSASKAAVDRFMVATGGNMKQAGILLTSVVCGFLNTPMVAGNHFPMPGLTDVDNASRRILRGLRRNERRIVFPRWLVAGSRFMDLLPIRLAEAYYTNQPTGAAGSMPEPDLS